MPSSACKKKIRQPVVVYVSYGVTGAVVDVDVCLDVFFFNDTATTEIYTLSLHDALPIYSLHVKRAGEAYLLGGAPPAESYLNVERIDRKSTRLNSSHTVISYAVFCL